MKVEQLALVPFSFPTYANVLGRAAIRAARQLESRAGRPGEPMAWDAGVARPSMIEARSPLPIIHEEAMIKACCRSARHTARSWLADDDGTRSTMNRRGRLPTQ